MMKGWIKNPQEGARFSVVIGRFFLFLKYFIFKSQQTFRQLCAWLIRPLENEKDVSSVVSASLYLVEHPLYFGCEECNHNNNNKMSGWCKDEARQKCREFQQNLSFFWESLSNLKGLNNSWNLSTKIAKFNQVFKNSFEKGCFSSLVNCPSSGSGW